MATNSPKKPVIETKNFSDFLETVISKNFDLHNDNYPLKFVQNINSDQKLKFLIEKDVKQSKISNIYSVGQKKITESFKITTITGLEIFKIRDQHFYLKINTPDLDFGVCVLFFKSFEMVTKIHACISCYMYAISKYA